MRPRRPQQSDRPDPGQELTVISRCSTVLKFWLAVATVLAVPVAAIADCQTWQLLRIFNAVQENGFNVVFEIDKPLQGNIVGRAHYYSGNDFARTNGHATGTFDGNVLRIQVTWQDDTLGLYDGYVERGGSLAGFTRNLSAFNGPKVRWRSKQTFTCAKLAPPPVDIIAKPTGDIGVGLPKRGGIVNNAPGVDVLGLKTATTGLAGVWDTVTSAGGRFKLTLNKSGRHVSGAFVHSDARYGGTLQGTLNDAENQLAFTFTQPSLGLTGQGTFRLTGKDALDGRFTVNDGPGNVFLWTGTRRP